MIESNCRKIILFKKSEFLCRLDRIVGKFLQFESCGLNQIVEKFIRLEKGESLYGDWTRLLESS